MSTSQELQSILKATPADFASPDADYRDVRKMFAPFHGHAVNKDCIVSINELGGVRRGHYALDGREPELLAFDCHGGALAICVL